MSQLAVVLLGLMALVAMASAQGVRPGTPGAAALARVPPAGSPPTLRDPAKGGKKKEGDLETANSFLLGYGLGYDYPAYYPYYYTYPYYYQTVYGYPGYYGYYYG